MKKYIIILPLIVVTLFAFCFFNPPYIKADTFSLDDYIYPNCDYHKIIEEYSSDIVLGYTPDEVTARKYAVKVWKDIYGSLSILDKPYHVSFDKENECWLVTGGQKFVFSEGGMPYIIIRKSDGNVLAVWHDK